MQPSIRMAECRDAARILGIYGPLCRDSPVTFEVEAPTTEEMAGRISGVCTRYPWLVLELGQKLAGYAYASQHRVRAAYQWSADVSVYVAADQRRRGVGRALYVSLLRMLTLQGYYNAYAGIALPNAASVRLHESLGFTPIGIYHRTGYKSGEWHDVGWWGLVLQEHDDEPAIPLPPSAIAGWAAAIDEGLARLRFP